VGLQGGLMAGEVCGAVSGAVLAIGLLYGQDQAEAATHLTEQFMSRFVEQNGSVRCSDIIGFNIGSIDTVADLDSIRGLLMFGFRGGKKMCNGVVSSAVQVLLEELNNWES
jgi:C_GCAxxG_C_C family probable redox protein